MAKPLTKRYSTTHPYVVERHDEEDGSITYEVWDLRPNSYRRLCSISEHYDSETYSDEDRRPQHCAKSDAEMIVRALNLANGGLPNA
jgi:hypothetical protein